MIQRVAVGILLLILVFSSHDVINGFIHDWRTTEVNQNEIVVTAAETTKDIVLDEALFGGNMTEVDSITSTIVESPVATTYVEGTLTLTVSALDANETRTLTITYNTEDDSQMISVIGPFLSFFIYGGVIGAVIYSIWSGRKS